MADSAETGSDAQITFKVKTSADSTHTLTMAESASVLDLKTKLAAADMENVPVDRQRLIYSGRVMKNDDSLASYKIKPNNTIHMVKSAASNPPQPASSSSTSAPQAVPTNMASGTANNPLAGLTGARFAGHQVNLPDMDMFGPDGGMGAPMDEERMARMMSDPNLQQTMNEALSNPEFVNMLIDSNPVLRNIPNARALITSPFMREMMRNPAMLGNVMRMQRGMHGGGSPFPAPGATDTTPQNQADGNSHNNTGNQTQGQGQQAPMPEFFSFMGPFGRGGAGGDVGLAELMQGITSAGAGAGSGVGAGSGNGGENTGQRGVGSTTGTNQTGTDVGGGANAPNPFAALFPEMVPGAATTGAGAGTGGGAGADNPFAMTPEQMRQVSQLMGSMMGGGAGNGAPAAPADNRPPEERYEEQLRQLNDMGFFDFDRNVAALRRSGGSVQGAVEHLLSGGV